MVATLNRGASAGTWALIQRVLGVLGTTNTTFWPGFESTGTLVSGIGGRNLTSSDEAGTPNLQDEFAPVEHGPMGIHSYMNVRSTNNHLAGTNDNAYSFGDGSVDSAFSAGCWVMPFDLTTEQSLLAVYNTTAAEEWDLRIEATSGHVEIEFHDASASATEIGTTTAGLVAGEWSFVVMSYDGTETAPVANLYINGTQSGDGTTTETGAYVAMENTATPLLVGARGLTAAPLQELNGRIALPFVCGAALTAAQVTTLHTATKELLGL